MPTEGTPLRSSTADAQNKHDDVYLRFSKPRKKAILAIISWTGLIQLFSSGSFVPSIPQIAQDLKSTGSVVSLAVSLSILGTAIGSLTFASYSSFYGRKPIYVSGLPLFCLGSLGVALSQNVPQVMGWHFLQAIGSSPGLSVSKAVIGDIYKLEERGTAIGIFLAAVVVGPALAPFLGGVATHYFSWRYMQYALFLQGLSAFILVTLFLPETSHPQERGIDKVIETSNGQRKPWEWVWINPFRSLCLLRSPNLMAVSFAAALVLLTGYVLVVPLAYTIGKHYHITNEALIGACFLPVGLGNIIGASLAGRISDQIVIKWRKRRAGKWVPEDRLRPPLWGALTLVPLSILISGLLTQFVGSNIGLALNLICLFMNGIGVDTVLSPTAAYVVDIMHSRSAEAMAVYNAFRSVFLSVAIAAILPSINLIGVAATNAISAMLAWLGFVILWYMIWHGDRMRAWSDNIGYSSSDNN